MADLSSKTALVTGASRGLGRATAKRLAADGARVIAHYGASREAADTLVAEIRDAGGRADVVAADLAAADGPWALAEAVRGLGVDGLDILIANAGVANMATLAEETVEQFDRMFAVNVRAPFFLVQQVAPLIRDGGSIVLLSSAVGRIAFAPAPAYAATKGAIDTLVRSFAADLGGRNIRVNGLAPGAIRTDMNPFLSTDEGRNYILGTQALKRVGEADDIADAVAFLASDDARWITGRIIEASGGMNL